MKEIETNNKEIEEEEEEAKDYEDEENVVFFILRYMVFVPLQFARLNKFNIIK